MQHEFASGGASDPTPRGPTGDPGDHGHRPHTASPTDDVSISIDLGDPAFAVRLARLMVHRRESIGVGVGAMARRSNGVFSRSMLRDLEAGTAQLDAAIVSELVALYGIDLDDITPARIRIRIDRSTRTLSAGGVAAHFDETDPDELLRTYLRLVRRLRDQHDVETITLRRDDVEDLARFLGRPPESVLHRLCDLMGSTRSQRRMVVGMCLAGAMVVTVAVPSAAALRGDGPVIGPRPERPPADPTLFDPMARPIIDPFVNPFVNPLLGSDPVVSAMSPLELPDDAGPLIVVDIDGNWDRDAVLDEEGRLRWPTRTPAVDADGADDDPRLDPAGAADETRGVAGIDEDGGDVGSAGAGVAWIPPFPERIVDPGTATDR